MKISSKKKGGSNISKKNSDSIRILCSGPSKNKTKKNSGSIRILSSGPSKNKTKKNSGSIRILSSGPSEKKSSPSEKNNEILDKKKFMALYISLKFSWNYAKKEQDLSKHVMNNCLTLDEFNISLEKYSNVEKKLENIEKQLLTIPTIHHMYIEDIRNNLYKLADIEYIMDNILDKNEKYKENHIFRSMTFDKLKSVYNLLDKLYKLEELTNNEAILFNWLSIYIELFEKISNSMLMFIINKKNENKWRIIYKNEFGYPESGTSDEKMIFDRRLQTKIFLNMKHEEIKKKFIDEKFINNENYDIVFDLINEYDVNNITNEQINNIVNEIMFLRYP